MIYVTSDLHGYSLERFKKQLASVGFSKNDCLYIIGDVVDRGEAGVDILKWLLTKDNIKLILGNHETMLLKCAFIFENDAEEWEQSASVEDLRALRNWKRNGAAPTINALRSTDTATRAAILGYLRNAPLYKRVEAGGREFVLVHGGFCEFEEGRPVSDYDPHDLVWTRPSLEDVYSSQFTTVVGHTPTQLYGSQYSGRAVCTDTWIDIDTGAAYGGAPMLLCLDDMREFYADKAE